MTDTLNSFVDVRVTLNCGQCGRSKVREYHVGELPISPLEFVQHVAGDGDDKWVVEVNGKTIDTYCSKRCAR